MNRLDKFFTKNQNKLVGILAVIILSWFMGKLLDWIWSKPSGILKLLEFKVEVPIFAIILSVIVVWLFYRIYIKWAVSKRGLKIIKAEYGANNSFVDITAELNAKVNEAALSFLLMSLKTLSQKTLIALASMFSLLTAASVFAIAYVISASPTTPQLVLLGIYAAFVVVLNLIRRK